MKYTLEDHKNAVEMLKKFAPQGSTIHCVLRSRSRSGMSRRIDFFVITTDSIAWDGDPTKARLQYLTGWMCVLLGVARSDKGMRVDGCGMDMGFHIVDTLASALYGRDAHGIGKDLRHEWV